MESVSRAPTVVMADLDEQLSQEAVSISEQEEELDEDLASQLESEQDAEQDADTHVSLTPAERHESAAGSSLGFRVCSAAQAAELQVRTCPALEV